MSWDIFLNAHHNGENHYFPLSIVLQAFGPAITFKQINEHSCTLIMEYVNPDAEKYNICPVSDAEINQEIIVVEDEIMIAGFCVNRPPGHEDFWKSLYTVIRLAPAVLYWSAGEDEPCMAIGRAEMAHHLPQSMRDALGEPVLVGGYQDILKLLKA